MLRGHRSGAAHRSLERWLAVWAWPPRSHVSFIHLARRIWQRHRFSVPLSLASAMFFARLAWGVQKNELDVFDAGAQKLVDGWRGSGDELMVLLVTAGSAPPMVLLVAAVLVRLSAAGRN